MTEEAAGSSERLGPRLAGRFRPAVWGLFDQGLVSGVNFLTIVILGPHARRVGVRVLQPSRS